MLVPMTRRYWAFHTHSGASSVTVASLVACADDHQPTRPVTLYWSYCMPRITVSDGVGCSVNFALKRGLTSVDFVSGPMGS